MLDEILARETLRQAFWRVRDNHGCRGADGMTVHGFEADLDREIDRLQDRLLRRCYHPYPLLEISVPKRSAGVRRLCIPTVRDRVAQTAVDLIVRPIFEAEFEDCSYAFRRGRSVTNSPSVSSSAGRQSGSRPLSPGTSLTRAFSCRADPRLVRCS